MSLKIFILCSITLSILACNSKIDNEVKRISVSKSTLKEFGNLDNYVNFSKFITLETIPNALIGKIDKLIQYNDDFYILDSDFRNNILRFDSKGKFLGLIVSDEDRLINKLSTIKDFDIFNGNIYFNVSFSHFIFVKSLTSGKFSKIKIPNSTSNIKVLDTNKIFLYSGYGNSNENNSRLYLTELKESECIIINKFLPSDSVLNSAMYGSATLRFVKSKESYLVHDYGNDSIYSIGANNSRLEYILNFDDNNLKDYLRNKLYQDAETHQDFIDKNSIFHKSCDIFVLDNLLSIDYYGDNGERQLVYDMDADTIIANCNYYSHKTERLPISFYWFPVENNTKQVITFYTSEDLAELPKETQDLFSKKIGKKINENDNPILVILEKK